MEDLARRRRRPHRYRHRHTRDFASHCREERVPLPHCSRRFLDLCSMLPRLRKVHHFLSTGQHQYQHYRHQNRRRLISE